MEVITTLTNREAKVLRAIAKNAGVDPLQYAKNIIRNFLKGQIRGIYQKEFNKKTEDELASFFGEIID